MISDQRIADIICNVQIRDSIEGLDNLLRSKSDEGGYLTAPLSHAQQAFLMEAQDSYAQLPPVRLIGRNQVAAIVDAVRTTILEWALRLEAEGILGHNLSFTAEEKNKAMSSQNININNFQGVLGSVSDSNVTQNLNMTIPEKDVESLVRFLSLQGVEKGDLDDLRIAIREDSTPQVAGRFGDRVSAWIGGMLTKASSGAWSISVGAAGNLLATALSKYYGL